MRRIIQTVALLLLFLAGSLPVGQLAAAARMDACCAAMAKDAPCPCRLPGRAPGTNNPCGMGGASWVSSLAVPPRAGQTDAQAAPAEPSPIPAALRASAASRCLDASPAFPARPAPAPPDLLRPTQAHLSIFRI